MSNPFPVMEHMTVKMVRDYLGQRRSIIIPLGVIEQHGYHLPLNTDALIATHIARRIGERTGILVAPAMHHSFSGGGLPGTINISPAVMSLVLSDMLVSLVSQGFRNFYLLLCHGGSENARALDNAIKVLLRVNPAFEQAMVALLPVWELESDGNTWSGAFREGDWHAGWVETSLVMALEPGLVRLDELALDPEPLLSLQIEHPDNYQHAEKIVDSKFVVPRMTQRPDIRVGVMGYPERASRETGERIVERVVRDGAARILDLESKADGVYKEIPFTPEPLIFDI
ncbi:MAG TPA: creatininase family protein [Candidatus Hydrogenedentes bacterium]|nr:creatininase family protein [Candidatus Hydrogenedentota bacterium]HQH53127.1 creatininase family protein [Candidatus Hydrogenedentota bacterium]HQM48127.1 creatininase family protein [Candidatus Hydrogenedentota bacterium]